MGGIMSIILQGSTSGSITLQEPAVSGSTVLSLPAVSGTILTTGSSGQSIPKAALPTGSVLQVVNATYATDTTTTSTSYVATGISASITPTSSTSKIFIVTTFPVYTNAANLSGYFTLYRGASNLFNSEGAFRQETSTQNLICAGSISYFDSPATTSSTTYAVYFKSQTSGITTRICLGNATASITLLEIAS